MLVMCCFLFNALATFALVVADRRLTDQIYRNMLQVVADRRQQGQKADTPDLQKYVAGRC